MFDSDRENATIKLIDFGFCKIFEGEADMFAVLGSPYYVAPEVLHVSANHLCKWFGMQTQVVAPGALHALRSNPRLDPCDGNCDESKFASQARSPMGSYAGRGYGPAADMWSVGVISYMVLCGQAPFDGNTDTERLSAVRKGVFAYPPQASLSRDAVSFINGAECHPPTC
jgi:serine/threonine protein kinase